MQNLFKMKKQLLVVLLLFFVICNANAQYEKFLRTLEVQDSINTINSREKIYIHYDRPQYHLNDTLWLKGYITTGALQFVNDSSRIACIEFIDDNGVLVKRISAVCEIGFFNSNLILSASLFSQGNYTLRAYTNYMRNFGDSLFYTGTFKIIDPEAGLWNVRLKNFSFSGNKLSIAAVLNAQDNLLMANSKIGVKLLAGKKVVFKANMITDNRGNLYIDTLLDKEKLNGKINLEISSKKLRVKVPVPNVAAATDLQFLPEGGSFVAGKLQRLGIKAINLYGKGVNVNGYIQDSRGNKVGNFATFHKGMGVVNFTPKANEIYTAYTDNGDFCRLPPVTKNEPLLRAGLNAATDSILLTIDVGEELKTNSFFVTAAVRGAVYLRGKLQNKTLYEIKVLTNTFPDGIVRFTLYNEHGVPLNERVVFVNKGDSLKMNITTNKESYVKKDSVGVNLLVKNYADEPVMGCFSVAVIDTSQIGINPTAENIVSYMILTSDLKGTVEDPVFYMNNPYSPATDALMLTQGWVSYTRTETPIQFAYEKEFTINGKVTNIINKGTAQTKVTLLAKVGKTNVLFKDTVTNKNGLFTFNNFPVFENDTVSSVIKAVNKNGKSFGVGVEVFEKNYPLLPETNELYSPESFLFDTAVKKTIDNNWELTEQLKRSGNYLQEVIVTAVTRIPGSKNLNEDGAADVKITTAVLEKTPKESLHAVLIKHIPGFPVIRSDEFKIGRRQIVLVFDGIDLSFFQISPYDVIDYYSAEDVKGIEIMNSVSNTVAYQTKFNIGNISFMDPPIYIEITTYGGVGPFLKKVPGTYLLRPEVPVLGRNFYSPKYTTTDEPGGLPDFRKTIYWKPFVVTNQKGEAEFSFYTSESKGGYVIIVQGTDLKGGFGALMYPVQIK